MNYRLVFSFVTLGISSLIAQVLLFRELMVVFYGNELFVGWILFSWLLWVGLGSLVSGKIPTCKPPERILIACHVLVACLVPLSVAAMRFSKLVVGGEPGEIPNLLPSLGFAFLAFSPLCLLLGLQFVIAARIWNAQRAEADRALGRSYVYETIGFVVAGAAFAFLLVKMNEFRVATLVSWLNVAAATLFYALPRNRSFALRLLLILISAAVAVVFFLGTPLGFQTARLRFRGQDLIETRNSIYGNLAVTRLGNQYNFYENGLLLGPDRDEMAAEYLVHFPLLYHPDPRRVLIIGGGLNGPVAEILKHRPDVVDYVELDPELVRMCRKYLPTDLDRALDDPRVRIANTDGRFFLRNMTAERAEPYDVILVNLPNPSTALINRFYTLEFFRELRRHLKPDGIVATHLAFSPDYLSRELEDLGASVYKTIGAVFGSVIILPEYSIFYIATPGPSLSLDAKPLIERLAARKIETKFLTPQYIEYRLTTDRIPQVMQAFRGNRTARLNRDAWPAACYYNLAYWISAFQPRLARFADHAATVPFRIMAGALLLTALAGFGESRRGTPAAFAMAVGSFTLMACEVIIILAFQVFCGYLYYRIALIIAVLMLGMTMGTRFATDSLDRKGPRTLAGIHALAIAFCLGLALVSKLLSFAPNLPSSVAQAMFLLMAAVIGGLIGFEFPVANKLYLARCGFDERKTGVIYGVDLLGSCIGALLVSMGMLPVIGSLQTLGVVALLNGLVLLLVAKDLRRENV